MRKCALILTLALSLSAPALTHAQQYDEIVVTAQKRMDRAENLIPHVALAKRPDFVVVELVIESDSRDLKLRREELISTLTDLERKARASSVVSVALLQKTDDDEQLETKVKPYSLKEAEELIESGRRADTSRVEVLLKTAVRPDDTLERAEGRIEAFVRGLPKPGRVMLTTGDVSPTLVNPGQYRMKLIELIAADAKAIGATLGPGYAAHLKHLESRIYWMRTGDLELLVYLPHELEIEPAR